MQQGQDEFYFALPYKKMDIALWALNNEIPAKELAKYLKIDESHAEYIYKDIEVKRKTTMYLRSRPVFVEEVAEISD